MRTNQDKVVMMSLQGKVSPPERSARMGVDADGIPFALPGTGGITYNVLVGDPAFGWAGDHIEPGVSTRATLKAQDDPNPGYHFLACVGNKAIVVSGDAKGAEGVVTGHHGGSERVMIDLPHDAMEKMTLDDSIMIRAFGQGLELSDFPTVRVSNIDPNLLEKMGIEEKDGKLYVPVTHKVPGELMGSGVGSVSIHSGDYDIMTADKEYISELGLNKMLLGDIVAIMNHDNIYGRAYRRGAVTIGIVIHSDCRYAGHGPGVTTLLSSRADEIVPIVDEKANIAKIMRLGRFR